MSAIALLMGLLVLSFLGNLIVGGRAARGLPSGVEFLGLGFAVGPYVLGLVTRPMIVEFEPVVQVALAWLAFVTGLDFGRVEGRRVRAGPMAAGILLALGTGAAVTLAIIYLFEVLPHPGIERREVFLLAAGVGAVSAETTSSAVHWVAGRFGAKGPVTKLLHELAASDDLAPLVAAGVLFSFYPGSRIVIELPSFGWFGVALALGALLGTVTALLLRGAEGYAVWGALLGTMLLGVGTASRFALCTIFVAFVMGVALAAVSPTRRALRRLVVPTERAVLYPLLLLAGAQLDPQPILESRVLAAVVALALLARIVAKLATGLIVRGVFPTSRPAGSGLGIVLLSSGPVSISIALVFALRFPGRIGNTLLVCAAASAVLGEIVSTFALKRMLTDLGEIPISSESDPRPPESRHEEIAS